MKEITLKGTPNEINTFKDVSKHYSMASQDLEQRIFRKNGFDDSDKMFASYIDDTSWPYRSLLFDPRPYTTILEKSARLIGSKPKGRLVPREGGDELGAMINNELLSYQWEDNTRLGESMISKWMMMDQNARKYGSAFMVCVWRWEKRIQDVNGNAKKVVYYDGPDAKVCNPRDVLANPSYSSVNKWFQYREWVTMDDLMAANDAAKTEPIYKNLDILKSTLREEVKIKGDKRESKIQIKNKSIRGLTDYLGSDEVYPVIELITEYRPNRWITFAPRHGIIIRDIPNPYIHGEIPIVHLKYYPNSDDLYGISELEPVAKQIKAINAHLSAYSDTIALALRPPIHVNPINVRMHTLEWNPEAKWLMNTPNVDVQQMHIDTSMTSNFQSIYSVLVGSLMNAMGEQSQQQSSINPFSDNRRITATEIADTSQQRNVRDNMNQIFLSEALKKQIMFWHSMNQQFMFKGTAEKQKIIRIVGKDAAQFFTRQGLSDIHPTQEEADMIAQGQLQQSDVVPGPKFAVNVGQDQNGLPIDVPKFLPDESGNGGNLILEPGDLMGNYDYIPDIETMKAPSSKDIENKLTAILGVLTNPAVLQMLAAEGKKPKVSELLVKMFEATRVINDADQYFENVNQGGGVPPNVQNQINPGGGATNQGGVPNQGNVQNAGMAQSSTPMAGNQNPQLMGGSPPVQVG